MDRNLLHDLKMIFQDVNIFDTLKIMPVIRKAMEDCVPKDFAYAASDTMEKKDANEAKYRAFYDRVCADANEPFPGDPASSTSKFYYLNFTEYLTKMRPQYLDYAFVIYYWFHAYAKEEAYEASYASRIDRAICKKFEETYCFVDYVDGHKAKNPDEKIIDKELQEELEETERKLRAKIVEIRQHHGRCLPAWADASKIEPIHSITTVKDVSKHSLDEIGRFQQIKNSVLHKTLFLEFGCIDGNSFSRSHFNLETNVKKGTLFEFFEGKSFVADNFMLEPFKKGPSTYRASSLRQIEDALLDNQKMKYIDDPCVSVDFLKGMNLITVGGPRSNPSTRISLGHEVDGSISNKYGKLHYFYDISLSQNVIQDNFGQGVTVEPKTFLRNQKGDAFFPSTVEKSEGIELLTQDLALLTIIANPFNHSKRHIIVSACHGIGCLALSELINQPEFQKETKYIEFLDTSDHISDYYQALIRINVVWDDNKKHYEINKKSGRYYEVVNAPPNLSLETIRSVDDAIALYEEIVRNRFSTKDA